MTDFMSTGSKLFSDLRCKAGQIFAKAHSLPHELVVKEFYSLLHNLERYQIALEMKNDELEKAQIGIALSGQKNGLLVYGLTGYCTVEGKTGKIIKANAACSELLCTGRESLSGVLFGSFVSSDCLNIFSGHLSRVCESGSHRCEISLTRQDNMVINVRLESSAVKNGNGAVEHIHVRITDITDRRQIEAAVQKAHGEVERQAEARMTELVKLNKRLQKEISIRIRAEENLSETLHKYESLVHALGELIYEHYVGKDCIVWKGFENILGYNKNEMGSDGSSWLEKVHPDDVESVKKEFERAEKENQVYDCEYRFQRKDGEYLWFHDRGRMHVGEDGQVETVFGIMKNITDKKKMQAALLQHEAALQRSQKLEAVGTLAGGLAHDFNNILGGILNCAELINAVSHEKRAVEFSRNIIDFCRHGRDLVNRMLTFSGKKTKDPAAVYRTNLNQVVEDTIRMFRASNSAGVDIRTDIDEQLCIVPIERMQAEQIILNLCSNAAQAMEYARGRLTITVRVLEIGEQEAFKIPDLHTGTYVRLSVEDNGMGIAPENIDKIFEPFFSTKPSGQGTGLGLAVVYGIVKSHGGAVSVESRPEKGTTFYVFLPTSICDEPVRKQTEDICPEKGHVSSGAGRILFVDDEPVMTKSVKIMLEEIGYTVTAETRSGKALERFCKSPDDFDIVITDYAMPNMTGDLLAKEVMEIRPEIPVILCSGCGDGIDNKKIHDAGVKALLVKPYEQQQIFQAIREALNYRK